jgi:hypothetical protein
MGSGKESTKENEPDRRVLRFHLLQGGDDGGEAWEVALPRLDLRAEELRKGLALRHDCHGVRCAGSSVVPELVPRCTFFLLVTNATVRHVEFSEVQAGYDGLEEDVRGKEIRHVDMAALPTLLLRVNDSIAPLTDLIGQVSGHQNS